MSETTPFDARGLDAEDRQRLRAMMQSGSFRLLLERVVAPLLETYALQLANPHTSRDMDQFVKGQRYNMQQFLEFACKIADLPSLFPPRRATGLDLESLTPSAGRSTTEPVDTAPEDLPPRERRAAYTA